LDQIFTLAAPVLLGMMLNEAALPPLQSLADGPSTVFWVAGLQNNKDKPDLESGMYKPIYATGNQKVRGSPVME